MPKLLVLALMLSIWLAACGPASPTTVPVARDEPPPTAPPSDTATASPTAAATSTATAAPMATATPAAATSTATATPTATASPTSTASHTPTPRPSPTPTSTPWPALPPNPLGSVLVLEYHLIGEPEGRWQRTPAAFWADLERLHRLGYTPANVIDLALGFPDLPAGKKPIVLTFDDSDISQFRYLADGTIDPASAVGMLAEFHRQHPADWPLKATFYVLQDVDAPQRILFGQPEAEDKKLRWLVEQGFEVASHTISHFDLAAGSAEQVQWQLAVSQRQLEARLPGYRVRSLSLPFGNYPANEALLAQGSWDGQPYHYASTVMVAGGASPSPHSPDFDPYHIPRVQAVQNELDYWLRYFEQNPQAYYVSGGP